jgi:hypothetical protein
MTERKLSGTVIDMQTKRRYEGATLRLQLEGQAPAFANTDDDGDFDFDLTKEQTWPAGEYTLTVFHPDSLQEVVKKIKLEAGKAPEPQQIEMLSDQERSDPAGWAFLGVLVLMLGALFWGFLTLHERNPNKGLPLDESLTALVELAQIQAEKAITLTANSPVSTTIATAESVFTSLQKEPNQTLVNARKGEMVATLLSEAGTAIEAGDLSGLKTVLSSIDEAVLQPESYFWQKDPWRLVEILMWALAATIISLAISTGGYLYRRNFYWRAIPTRITLLVTIPIVAVVIAFVLSLVTISITVSGAEFKLDMSNVTMSILVAVLIGLAPWKAWGFLNGLANLFFSKLTVGPKEPTEKKEEKPTEEEKKDLNRLANLSFSKLTVGPKEPTEEKKEREKKKEEEKEKPTRQPTSTPKRSGPSEDWELPTGE